MLIRLRKKRNKRRLNKNNKERKQKDYAKNMNARWKWKMTKFLT